jgi:uncharacterized protein (DUF4415 family)
MKGGARPGAGRKRLPPHLRKSNITVRVTPAVAQWLRAQEQSYSALINALLATAMWQDRAQQNN